LLLCAEQAELYPDLYSTDIDLVRFKLANLPDFVQSDKSWSWGCIRTFLDAPIHSRPVQVPAALWNKDKDAGFLVFLVLEVLTGGGEVFPHPADLFTTRFLPTFSNSIRLAWVAAQTMVQGHPEESQEQQRARSCYDGRWRVLGDRKRFSNPTPISGSSAGGAATWGWYFALQNKIPDAGVIVLAEVRSPSSAAGQYTLAEVTGVSAKVKAIVKANRTTPSGATRIDTIVVASDANFDEAEETLCDEKATALLHVEKLDDTHS
jgi:hypothetical protein